MLFHSDFINVIYLVFCFKRCCLMFVVSCFQLVKYPHNYKMSREYKLVHLLAECKLQMYLKCTFVCLFYVWQMCSPVFPLRPYGAQLAQVLEKLAQQIL